MKSKIFTTLFIGLLLPYFSMAQIDLHENSGFKSTPNLKIKNVAVNLNADLQQLIFEIKVEGRAGRSVPKAFGDLDGAPVLGYVFPTTLKPQDVGFNETEGILALALTSHPDFDDTPLWDENFDSILDNDGIIWHPHWVVLTEDKRVAGGLSVKQFTSDDKTVKLPPTNPGMPMYMDSPGYPVITKGNTIKVVVPLYRISNKTNFKFDGVAAYMQVNTSDDKKPLLGVYNVYSVASGNLSLPYSVSK